MKQRRPSRSLPRILAAGALLASAATLYGHDFWLVPDAFQIAEGAAIAVRGQTSSRFPTSEAAVALDRVAEARLLSADGVVVEVGGGARAFARTAGHPLEFVPLSDPSALRAGERAAFRLLYRGRPALWNLRTVHGAGRRDDG